MDFHLYRFIITLSLSVKVLVITLVSFFQAKVLPGEIMPYCFRFHSVQVFFWGQGDRSPYVAQTGLNFVILLSLSLKCWNYRKKWYHSGKFVVWEGVREEVCDGNGVWGWLPCWMSMGLWLNQHVWNRALKLQKACPIKGFSFLIWFSC